MGLMASLYDAPDPSIYLGADPRWELWHLGGGCESFGMLLNKGDPDGPYVQAGDAETGDPILPRDEAGLLTDGPWLLHRFAGGPDDEGIPVESIPIRRLRDAAPYLAGWGAGPTPADRLKGAAALLGCDEQHLDEVLGGCCPCCDTERTLVARMTDACPRCGLDERGGLG